MTLYLSLFALLLLIVFPGFLGEYSANKQLRISIHGMLYVFAALLICLGGFRWARGTDWDGYFDYFNNLSLSINPFKGYLQFEPGYIFLNFFIKYIYNSYTLFLVIFTFLIVFFYTKGLQSISPLFPLSFFLFFCATKGGIFAVRITLARAILLYSINFIVKEKKFFFIVCLVIACAIHLSSLLFIVAYPLYHYRLRKFTLFILWCICIFCAFNTKLLIEATVMPILNQIGGSGRVVVKLFTYSVESDRNFVLMILYIIRYSLFIPVMLYFIQGNSADRGLFNIYFFGCLFFITFSTYLTQIQRAAADFTQLEWILLPVLYEKIRKKENKYGFIFFLFIYCFTKYYQSFYVQGYYDMFVPYASILF